MIELRLRRRYTVLVFYAKEQRVDHFSFSSHKEAEEEAKAIENEWTDDKRFTAVPRSIGRAIFDETLSLVAIIVMLSY